MSAAVIRFADLDGLGLRALVALARATARDIDAGVVAKRATLERIMQAIIRKATQ